jgi:hypothetical protein
MKNAVFWDAILCGYLRTELNAGTIICSMLQLLVAANVVPRLLILFTLIMEAIIFFETSVLTRATWHHIPEDGILQLVSGWYGREPL